MNKGMLFFNAPWCEPCKVLKPVMDQIKKEGIAVKSINTEYDAMNTEKYQVIIRALKKSLFLNMNNYKYNTWVK